MTRPAVSVVIATHNRPDRLAAQLASLRRQSLPGERFEVIVVDDGSDGDATARVLAAEQERGVINLRAIRNPVARGPASARNAGWRAGTGDLVAFTDDDCVARPRWLEAGVAAWGGRDDVLVQGRTTPMEAELDRLGPFAYSIEIEDTTAESETCNIFYPRTLLQRLDGFDETFRGPQGEDTDLGWRARALGATPVFAADAHVEHAVMELGPRGILRRAWRWTPTVRPYARHPELRRTRLIMGVFWNWTHYLLARALVALPLARRRWAWSLSWWLARRLLAYELEKARRSGGGLGLAGYWLLHDVIETAAVARGAVRFRSLIF